MKKKLIAVMLALAVTAVGFAGCGDAKGAGQPAGTESVGTENAGGIETEHNGVDNSGTENIGAENSEIEAVDKSDAGNAEQGSEDMSIDEQENAEVPILKDAVMSTMGCRIGAAATQAELNDPKVWEIITTHFNALTFGNELKPDAMFDYSNGRCPGTEEVELNGETITVPKIKFTRAESMLNRVLKWNQDHPDDQIKIRGHVLVWHSQTPEWFFHVDYDKKKDYVDKDTMNKRLEWYIKTMLTHFTGEDSKYKGMFYGWDVVNEAVSDNITRTYRSDEENPSESLSQDTHGSNSSWWHVYQSNEFIINAFIYANKYAPADLELYYNDYNECVVQKTNDIVKLLTAVKEREGEPGVGTRIDGMGMQGHYDMTNPTFVQVSYSAKKFAEVVGNVQITEFDIKARDSYDGSDEAKIEEYEKQAMRYRNLYRTLQSLQENGEANITGITFWGTVDHYSWLQSRSNVGGGSTKNLPQCPLLFDNKYQPKPAFYVFAETK